MTRRGGPRTSQIAAAKAAPHAEPLRKIVVAYFKAHALEVAHLPWNQRGLTDFDIEQALGSNGKSSVRSRREEATNKDNLLVFAGYQSLVDGSLRNAHRIREPGDPIYVPSPADYAGRNRKGRSAIALLLDGKILTIQYGDRAEAIAYLKRAKFYYIGQEDGINVYRANGDCVGRLEDIPGGYRITIRCQPYEGPITQYDAATGILQLVDPTGRDEPKLLSPLLAAPIDPITGQSKPLPKKPRVPRPRFDWVAYAINKNKNTPPQGRNFPKTPKTESQRFARRRNAGIDA